MHSLVVNIIETKKASNFWGKNQKEEKKKHSIKYIQRAEGAFRRSSVSMSLLIREVKMSTLD